MPMVLVTRMEDAAQVGLDVGSDQRRSVHDLRDVLESFTDLDIVNCRTDRWESAQHLRDGFAHFEGFVVLGIERVGGTHTSTHPQDNNRIRFCCGCNDLGAIGHGVQKSRSTHAEGCCCRER